MIIRYGGACCCGATASQIALTRTGEELCKADSVKAMFEIYYENNWIDKDGNVSSAG